MQEVSLSQIIGEDGVFVDGDWVESKDQDPNGDVRLIQLADIGDGNFINKSSRYLTSTKAKELNCTYLERGDLLVARMPDPIGRSCIFPGLDVPCVTVVDVCIVRPDKKRVFNNWLKFMINSPDFRNKINKFITGTTRQRISRGNLDKLKFDLPNLDHQIRIANILSKAELLISQRKESLRLLDEFLKSTFLEMFGDPITNPNQFPIKRLSEFYINTKEGTKCGPFGSALKKEEYLNEGVPVWIMDNISKSGEFIEEGCLWIGEEKFKALESYSVQNGDVIISRAGTVGKMCVVKSQYNTSVISTNLIRARFGKDLLPVYFVSLMNYCRARVARLRTGADDTFTHMNTGILDSIKFPYPAIELQTQFAHIEEKTQALKARYQTSLKELENLYGSLSQRAFRGELFKALVNEH